MFRASLCPSPGDLYLYAVSTPSDILLKALEPLRSKKGGEESGGPFNLHVSVLDILIYVMLFLEHLGLY